jgi:hypothetical protein
MLSRALSLAAVLLLIGSFASEPALAQENLDAGKTPSQIFAATCNACHKSPRGLLKSVPASSLPGFLRQHYTTSPNMASALASYLVSNGAQDPRIGGDAPKGAKGAAKQEARQEPRPSGPPQQLDRWGRPIHTASPPQEASAPPPEQKPETTDTPAPPPAEAAVDRGPDGRKMSPKQKLSKRGKPGEAAPESPTGAGEPKGGETATREEGKSDAAKSGEEGRSQSARIEQPPGAVVNRPDPVPQVTPAGPGGTGALPTTAPAQSQVPSAPVQAAISAPTTEMAVPLSSNAAPPPPAPPAVTASAPALPPVQPAGPPAPPISQ